MAGWQRCCCVECLIFEDDFTRSPGTPLGLRTSAPFKGKGWCDDPGDYYIDTTPTYRARCETPNALAICNVKHPDEVGSMAAYVKTQNEQARTASYSSGQKYRLLVNLVKNGTGTPEVCTSNSYYFGEYERFGGSINPVDQSWLRLGVVSGGVETILKERQLLMPETGGSRNMGVIIDENIFCVGITDVLIGGTLSIESPGLHANGWYSGFSLSEKDMLIDDYQFSRHFNSNPPKTQDLNCPRCASCDCEDNVEYNDEFIQLPSCLNVRVFTDSPCERLIELVECEFQICYDDIEVSWVTDGYHCCGGFNFRFACTSEYGINRYRLVNGGGCQQTGGDFTNRAPIEYECNHGANTGRWLFGPYCIGGTDFACGCRPLPCPPDGYGPSPPLPPHPCLSESCCYYVEVTT